MYKTSREEIIHNGIHSGKQTLRHGKKSITTIIMHPRKLRLILSKIRMFFFQMYLLQIWLFLSIHAKCQGEISIVCTHSKV